MALPALAAILLVLDTTAPDAPVRLGWELLGALLLLFGSLPLSLAMADHGLLLALRAGEHSRLTPRHGVRAARLAAWVDLAGPLQLALLTTSGVWLLARAWPEQPWAVAAVCLARAALDLFITRQQREASPRPLAGAVALWGWLLRPLVALGARGEPLPLPLLEAAADQALAEAIEVGDQDGELSLAETNLLRRELDFGRTTVGAVMVPWPRVEWLPIHAPFEETLRRAGTSPHSRFPVCRDDGQVVAVLHSKDLLPYLGQPPANLLHLLTHLRGRSPVGLPRETALDDALAHLRAARCSLAVVHNEAGRPVGVVAMEDLVEALVGDIVDESDAGVVRERLRVDGRRTLAELESEGVSLPGEADTTLAEFLAQALPDPPEPGVVWRHGAMALTVDALDADGEVDEVSVEWWLSSREAPR